MAEEVHLRIRKKWGRPPPAPTHFIYNGMTMVGKHKGIAEIPKFGAGWRAIRVEKIGHKYAHVVETGTGARARVELDLWKRLIIKGRKIPTAEDIASEKAHPRV